MRLAKILTKNGEESLLALSIFQWSAICILRTLNRSNYLNRQSNAQLNRGNSWRFRCHKSFKLDLINLKSWCTHHKQEVGKFYDSCEIDGIPLSPSEINRFLQLDIRRACCFFNKPISFWLNIFNFNVSFSFNVNFF